MKEDELLEQLDVDRALFGLFFAFGNRLQATGDVLFKEITCKQFFFIICLSLFVEEPPTINDLSEVMGSSHQNVKQIADKLCRAGYIKLVQDEEDRRKLRVYSTEALKDLCIKYDNPSREFMAHFTDGTTKEEREITYKTMRQIEKNLVEFKEKLL